MVDPTRAPDSERITVLADGNQVRPDELAQLLYQDLRRMASAFFRRESPGRTLQPTALVHEAYLRLANADQSSWTSRAHFLGVAAKTMRRVLIDSARSRQSLRRGAEANRVTLAGAPSDDEGLQVDLLDIEAALQHIGGINERYVQIIELRFFAGLTTEEVGRVLGVSDRMVKKDWAKARVHLQTFLERGAERSGG
ncbi:MAG: ECF-type sigma factor [Planctomycetota bacterium]